MGERPTAAVCLSVCLSVSLSVCLRVVSLGGGRIRSIILRCPSCHAPHGPTHPRHHHQQQLDQAHSGTRTLHSHSLFCHQAFLRHQQPLLTELHVCLTNGIPSTVLHIRHRISRPDSERASDQAKGVTTLLTKAIHNCAAIARVRERRAALLCRNSTAKWGGPSDGARVLAA